MQWWIDGKLFGSHITYAGAWETTGVVSLILLLYVKNLDTLIEKTDQDVVACCIWVSLLGHGGEISSAQKRMQK